MASFLRGGFSSIPTVTRHIIIINALIWLVEMLNPTFAVNGIIRHCGLHFVTSSHFNPAQIITYLFVHDNRTFFHVFFNMLTLFFFGPALERLWGARKFLLFYAICGVGAAVVQEVLWAFEWNQYANEIIALNPNAPVDEVLKYIAPEKNNLVTIGASGAIFGVLLGFAFVYPNVPMYLFFIPVPIKAKYMVAGYAVIEFFFGTVGPVDNVAHFAHLGGMLFALVLLLLWKRNGKLYGGHHGF